MPKRAARVDEQKPAPPPEVHVGGFIADAQTEAALAMWKAIRMLEVNVEAEVERARAGVRKVYDDEQVEYVESSIGTLSLQHRDGAEKIDWKSIALEGVAPKRLAKLQAKHTTVGDPAWVLSAPSAWSAEAKARPICIACAMALIPVFIANGLKCPRHDG